MSKTKEELEAEEAKAAAEEAAAAAKKAEEEKALAEEAQRVKDAEAAAALAAKLDDSESLKTIADLTKKLEEAEARIQLLTQESEAKIVETAKASKTEAVKSFVNSKVEASLATELGLDEVTAAIAAEYSFVELVKEFASLLKQVTEVKEEKAKAEAFKLAEARYVKLEEAGVAFKGEKASEQKDKLGKMTEEAFASYEADLKALASSIVIDPQEVIRQAKENAGAQSRVTKKSEDKYDKYKAL